jgi:hypothetical protein
MKNLFIIHATLSIIIILDVVIGRISNQTRNDTYDMSVISSIFAYWTKAPKASLEENKDKKKIEGEKDE